MRLRHSALCLLFAATMAAQQPQLDQSALNHPDASVRAEAAKRIGEAGLGAAAIDPLRAALEDADPSVRAAAAEALGLTGRSAGLAIPSLLEALADPEQKVRGAAAIALSRIDDSEATVQALVELLRNDPEADVRRRSIFSLEAIGAAAASAAPILREIVLEAEPGLSAHAAQALGKIPSSQPQETVRTLLDALSLGEPHMEAMAISSLGGLRQSPELVVPVLTQVAADSVRDVYTRNAAVKALGRFGPAAAAAIPDLARLINHPDPDFRRSIFHSLQQIDEGSSGKSESELITRYASFASLPSVAKASPQTGDVSNDVRRLAEIIRTSSDPQVRQQALNTLVDLGPAARPALDAIGVALADDDPLVRQAARRALVMFGPDATPVLIQALQGDRPEVRREAADAISELGDRGIGAIDALIHAIEASSGTDRNDLLSALAGLARFVPDRAYPLFLATLREGGDGVEIAVRALDQLRCAAAGAAPALERIVASGEGREDVRQAAVRGLAAVACADRDRAARILAARLAEIESGPAGGVHERDVLLYSLPPLKSADPAVLALAEKLLSNEEPKVRQGGLRILLAAGDHAASSADAVIAKLEDPVANVRMAAALALGGFPSVARKSGPVLMSALDDSSDTLRWAAAFALGDLPDAAQLSIPAFHRLLDDPSDRLREMAIRGLIHLDAVTPEVHAKIAAAVADPSPHVQRAIAFARAQGVLTAGQ